MNEAVGKIVAYALENVPYYMEHKDEYPQEIQDEADFRRIRPISKELVLEDPAQFVANPYKKFPLMNNLSIRRTSGSTGKYLKISWDEYNNTHSLLELWILRKRWYGINPDDPYCYFYTTEYSRNKLINENPEEVARDGRSIGFSKNGLSPARIREIYKRMLQFQPKWLMLQPSMAVLLSQCAAENHLPKIQNLQYMELTGEVLTDSARAFIETHLGAKIANQYGCNEANSIAFECPHGHMHIMTSNVVVEIMKDGEVVSHGQEGHVHITSLTNYAMPFIRYDTGDIGMITGKTNCPCGSDSPIFVLTRGRDNDFVIDREGSKLPAYIFMRPIEHINEKIGNIIMQYQVIQEGVDDFTVRLTILKSYFGWREEISRLFREYMRQPSLEGAAFNFEFHEGMMPDDQSGKLAFFMRHDF